MHSKRASLLQSKRILITGDAGRGKTTFACELKFVLDLPCYSTDNYQWKVKFTEEYERKETLQTLEAVYASDAWIVEGTSRDLVLGAIERADVIFYFCFGSLLAQWASIIRRYFTRSEDTLGSTLRLLRHVLYKRYHLGYMRGERTLLDELATKENVVIIHSFAEWRELLDQLV